jgi:hypothetical protein
VILKTIYELTPTSTLGRVAATVWVSVCLGVLAFGYVQRSVHDMPVAFTWFMIILTFPLGIPGVLLAGLGWPALMNGLGYSYEPIRDELPIWALALVLGYWQWFVLLPRALRWFSARRTRGEA